MKVYVTYIQYNHKDGKLIQTPRQELPEPDGRGHGSRAQCSVVFTCQRKNSIASLIIPEGEASEPYNHRTVGTRNHDFSTLVELQWLHQMRYATEGVCTRDLTRTNQPDEPTRCKLIPEMNVVLRRDQARAVRTSRNRKLHRQTPARGATDLDP